jgi:uncharacterized protein (DUF1778 family)
MDLYKNKRRTRAINFRLSEEEFRELKRACASGESRSVSDFARTAVWRMVADCLGAEPAAGAEKIELRLSQIEQQLSELAGLVRGSGHRTASQESLTKFDGGYVQKQSA